MKKIISKKKENPEIVYDNFKAKIFEDLSKKVPIYRGCKNKECFCVGSCREIIGYRDKLPNEY
jgi:hypothetical protein